MSNERIGEKASPQFRAWFDRMLPKWMTISEKVLAGGGEHIPMVLIFDSIEGGVYAIAPVPSLETAEDKAKLSLVQRVLAERYFAAVTVIEAWVLPGDKDRDQSIPISQHPEREEAMLFNAISGKQQLITSCRIERPSNKLRMPDTINDPTEHGIMGRMILNRPTKH